MPNQSPTNTHGHAHKILLRDSADKHEHVYKGIQMLAEDVLTQLDAQRAPANTRQWQHLISQFGSR